MRYLLLLILITLALPFPIAAQSQDQDGANAYIIATTSGNDEEWHGDIRLTYRGLGMVITYRYQTATKAALIVRYGGVVVGRWQWNVATSEVVNIVWLPCPCWVDLADLVAGI